MPRPAFKATEQQRRLTRSMAAYGVPQEDIAKVIGVRSPKTLRKHFRRELDLSAIEANTRVAQTAYRLAISGNSVLATMFWLRTRAGWKETCSADQTRIAPPPFIVALAPQEEKK